jgi:hypothetical protein
MEHCRTSIEQAARLRDAGIPEGYSISQLLYNPASQVVIIAVRGGIQDSTLPDRLLVRHVQAQKYELVGQPEQDVVFKSPVTCEKHPLLVFNSMRWTRETDRTRRGADWGGLYTFDLQNRELNLCVSSGNLVIPPPYDDRGWIADVFSLSDDGRHAYVRVGLGKREDDGEMKVIKMYYHVAQLDLETRDLNLITHLKNTWF